MNESLTIVIPVLDREATLPRVLRSVLAQTWRPLNVVLVDNGSQDSSLPLMQEWAERNASAALHVRVAREHVPGASAARQRGLELTDTRRVMFFDSDDELLPLTAQAYMEAFRADPSLQIALTSCSVDFPQGGARLIRPRGGDPLATHFHHCTLRTQAWAADTDLVRRAGGWDPAMRIWDDWELGLRLLLLSPSIRELPLTGCVIHPTPGSVTGEAYHQREPLYETPLLAAEKALLQAGTSHAARVAAMTDYRRVLLAALFAREGRQDLAHAWRLKALERTPSPRRRAMLNAAYAYIRRGGRGFDRLINLLY